MTERQAKSQAIPAGRQANQGILDTLKGLKGNALSKAKEELAVSFREAGWSYVRIAKELNYFDASGASRAYRRGRHAAIVEGSDELRALQVAQMFELHRAFWTLAIDGKNRSVSDRARAAKVILDIADHIAKLQGLYAPTQLEVMSADALEAVVERWKRELDDIETGG